MQIVVQALIRRVFAHKPRPLGRGGWHEQANNVVVKAEPSQALVDDHFLTLVKQGLAEDRVVLAFLREK